MGGQARGNRGGLLAASSCLFSRFITRPVTFKKLRDLNYFSSHVRCMAHTITHYSKLTTLGPAQQPLGASAA